MRSSKGGAAIRRRHRRQQLGKHEAMQETIARRRAEKAAERKRNGEPSTRSKTGKKPMKGGKRKGRGRGR